MRRAVKIDETSELKQKPLSIIDQPESPTVLILCVLLCKRFSSPLHIFFIANVVCVTICRLSLYVGGQAVCLYRMLFIVDFKAKYQIVSVQYSAETHLYVSFSHSALSAPCR